MERRAFIAILGAAAAWPLAARAQQPPMPVVGFLNNGSPEAFAPHLAAFQQGLGDAGYVDGQNVTIEYRWAAGDNSRLPALVADLVGRSADALTTYGEQPETPGRWRDFVRADGCSGYGSGLFDGIRDRRGRRADAARNRG